MAEAIVDWRVDEDGQLRPYVVTGKGRPVQATWAPQEGSQRAFLECQAFECLYEGTRGPGKTDTVIMDFAQHCGPDRRTDKSQPQWSGWGAEWRGILFRQTFPQLSDVIVKTKKWFPLLFPEAKYNESTHTWVWPTGETLRFAYGAREADYWNYHGHCVDEGEVLTRNGWVAIENVRVGDEVLSADEANRLSWQRVASVTHDHYNGQLVRHEGRGRYMSFTPNHRLPTVSGLKEYCCTGRNVSVRAAGWLWEGETIESFEVPEVSRGPRDSFVDAVPTRISGDDFCTLLGWYLSEGCLDYCAVQIAQEKIEHRPKIKALLDRLCSEYRTTDGGFSFLSKSWSSWLKQFGKSRDKFVPAIVKNASRQQLQLFFDAYVDGDGTRQGQRVYVYTISKRMADDLAEIAVRLGYAVYVTSGQKPNRDGPGYTVACNPRPVVNIVTDNRERRVQRLSHHTQVHRVQHTGMVYCLGVENNHTFFIRQRGSVWLSGNSWPWMAFEELTTWNDPGFFLKMQSCCRSTVKGIPKKLRATTNPYGPGHNWVKARYHLPLPPGRIEGPLIREKDQEGKPVPERMAIHGFLDENKILLMADPEYKSRIRAAARNKAELAAWMDGSWDIVAGGMFDDVWDAKRHVVPVFDIPHSWRIDRSFDWGSSRPFSVGWWAESDGSDIRLRDGRVCSTVRGDLFRIGEWYGWTGQPNEGKRMLATDIAKGIIERELALGIHGRCKAGPADAAIFKTENGVCIANDLMTPVIVNGEKRQIRFVSSNSAPGTRKIGWELMRRRFLAAAPQEGHRGPREFPGLFVFDRCEQFRRTVPVLPRDDKDLDDVDSDTEDHIADESRYRCMFSQWRPKSGTVVGVAG